MKVKIDRDADALYLALGESAPIESEEISPGVVLDYDADGKTVGIELLHLSKQAGKLDLSSMTFETVG